MLGCTPVADNDDDCARSYIATFGRRAFRRPLTDEEVETWFNLHEAGRVELASFYGGVFLALAGMLQSPNFLYIVEVGEPDEDTPGQRRLTDYELAAKMSFFVRGTTPSDPLLDAAEAGNLRTVAEVRSVAADLLESEDARATLDVYFTELLELEGLDAIVKVPSAFPDLMSDFDEPSSLIPEFGSSARGETLALLRDIIWDRDADFRTALTADYTFLNPLMEFFYFGTIGTGTDPDAFTRVDLPPAQGRAGILGHVSLLSMLARSDRTSPTLRGKFIREAILCDAIPPPPDDVEFMLPDDTEAPTMREKLLMHQENEACAACHIALDNLGFALEHYDGLGFYRTLENGYPIDASADLPEFGTFDGVAELGALLAESPKVPMCTVRKLYRHAVAHVETDGEQVELDALVDDYVADDANFKALMVDIVASPAFRFVGEEE